MGITGCWPLTTARLAAGDATAGAQVEVHGASLETLTLASESEEPSWNGAVMAGVNDGDGWRL